MINEIKIEGYLGAEPTVTNTKTNKSVANFSLGHSAYWKDKAGEKQTKTSWFNIEAWDGLAAQCSSLKKGSRVIVFGKTETNPRKDKNGNTHENLRVIASDIRMIDVAKKQEVPANAVNS